MKKFNRRWQILILVLMLISLACNLTLPGVPSFFATPTPTPQPLPPTIVETVPQIGSELPLQAPLLIYFSEPMDRASVQAGLTADVPASFLFNWMDDSTLSLTPKAALPAEVPIDFTLATGARAANGLALLQPLTFSYQTAGLLHVAQVLPAPQAKDVSPDSAVVVTFNQPVVPLGADAAGLPAGLSIDPAVSGKGEWLNTSTYIFHADPVLAGGTDYVVHVNPQLVSTGGAKLDASGQNVSWAFHTSFPALQDVTPKVSDGALLLDAQFQLTFNQPMQRASVEAGFALNGPQGKIPGSFVWNDKSTVLTFTPTALLDRAVQVGLTLNGQSRSSGGAALGTDTSLIYQTVPAFGEFSLSFPNGTTRPSNKGIDVSFTAPLAKYSDSELQSLITINPEASSPGYYVDGATVNVNSFFSPGKTYTVTFSANLKDRWGQALGKDYVFSFHEPDAPASLQFVSSLPALFTRPDHPVADVQAVNIHTLTAWRGTFSLPDFFRYQTDYNFHNGYQPADLQTWTVNPGQALNQNSLYSIDFSQGAGKLSPGLYYVNATSSEVQKNYFIDTAMLVSNVNVTLKTSATGALVWATDLRTQTPVAGIPLFLYDEAGHLVVSGTTDANGMWQGQLPLALGVQPSLGKTVAAPAPRPAQGSGVIGSGTIYAILGQPGDDLFGMASSAWGSEISPWNFGLIMDSDSSPTAEDIYLYTERPVYRPGDVIHYRGVLRNRYNGRYTDAGKSGVKVSLMGPSSNSELAGSTLPVSPYGSFSGEFSLPAGAIPGYYSINVDSGAPDGIGTISFQVADYRKPEINLSVALSPSPAVSGQALVGKVTADYFFGAPVGDLPFDWAIYTSSSAFEIPEFQTGLYQSTWLGTGARAVGSPITSGSARTAADGTFSIPLDNIQVNDTTQLTLEVTASESGGFPVSARDTLILHPAKFYAGVRPGTWFGQAGTEMGFDILTVDWDQKAVPNKTLTANFEKVTWTRSDLAYSYEFTPTYTPVDSQMVTTDASGKAHAAFTPAQAGTYLFEVSGEGAKTQLLLWVGGTQDAVWPNLPYQHITLTADKAGYKPGDTAGIFIPNPFGVAAPALITTERSTILAAQLVSIPAGGYTFNLPLTDDHAPNTYVSATLLGPDNDFRQGYIDLPVEPSAFTLNVDLKATPEKARPGDNVTLDLTVTDSKGQPVQAEFSMAVVDLAALALADPNSADILPAYYDVQPIGVHTGLTAAVYAGRYFVVPGGLGGGGGGGENLTLRQKFPDTAYWKADIVTDAQGKAQVNFTLPDSLTTWQVDSRGLTRDMKVGQARVQVVTSKDLLIRPQTPGFLVVGDHAQLAAIVNNTTSAALDGTASLQAGGFTLDDPAAAEQKIHIPANGRVRVAWSGLVQAGDSLAPVFSVKAGSLQDASGPADGPIPVLHYTAPQTFATAGVLAGAATRQEIIALPKTFQPLGGRLDLELSPSLAAAVLSSLQGRKSSEDTISWSNELLASDFLPTLATYQTLKAAGLSDPALSSSVNGPVMDDIRRLLANQSYVDGGWSWTTAGSNLTSDPYLSAYILFALDQAGKAGLGIDVSDALARGYKYLVVAAPLDGKSDFKSQWVLNRAVFQEYVLSQIGEANMDFIDTIYAGRDRLDPWARALLAETLLSISPTDTRASDLLSNLQTTAIRSATGTHWESSSGDNHNPGSALFTTALVVYSLSQHDGANPLLADAVRYLASQRGAAGWWGSSYEATWVTLALDRYMKSTGELQGNFSFSSALNGTPLANGQASGAGNLTGLSATAPLTQLNLSQANSLLVSRAAGPGNLYYRATLSVDRPVETAPALEQGLAVRREFLSCQAQDCQPISSYQMTSAADGRVQVKLIVTLLNDAYYLMLQDNIPAGAQILDSSLKTSQQGLADQSVQVLPYDTADPFSEGWGWWYFNTPQIYTDHILWSADYLPAGTYVLTYTIIPSLPGQYRVLPAHAWQAYFPEVQGTSAGSVFEIKGP